jgi:alkanesulfonate monooxygenase SsuD/methylene tetrahydromethanopterin reductase-like flavin-dependent oxidoreductase (luciferase family)
VGRGSFIESYPLFGFDLEDYDSLFSEKLELLLEIRENTQVHWSGKHRAALTVQGVYPRPIQNPIPIRIGVGGTPQSFARAGLLGLPLAVAIIGGEPRRFRPLIDLYREAGRRAGHSVEKDVPAAARPVGLDISVHSVGFIADTKKQASDEFYPPYAEIFGRIGKERGWPPISRPQFDASCGPTNALLVGDPESIAEKILYENEVLGGISRMTILLNGGVIPHRKAMHAIELLGTRVAPVVRKELASLVGSKSQHQIEGLEKAA